MSSSVPATAEDVSEGVSEPSILVKACQCLESNGKVRIASSSCRAKS